MTHLSIQLLGPIQVELDGEPVTGFATDKVRALLAYLAIENDRPHRRESLAGLLWGDHSESAARANLRRALADLRQVIRDHDPGPPRILANRKTIQLNGSGDVWVDTSEFARRIAADTADDLEYAVALYRGRFMEGFSLGDSPQFEEWALLQREKQQRDVLTALGKLADHYETDGDLDKALAHTWKQLELDPWRETAHRQVMRLLASSGRRSEALGQYQALSRTLANDLDVEPEAATVGLYESIRAGELDPEPSVLRKLPEGAGVQIGECPYRGLSSFREADAPFFFGREDFVARLVEAVQRQPVVAVIVGSSGAGKSSAVFAGLLPRLRAEDDWLIVPFRPGADPFTALANAIIRDLEPDLSETDHLVEARRLSEAFRLGELPVGDALRRALEKTEHASRLLLVVDQSEELYTLCPDPDVQRRFLDALLDAADQSEQHLDHSIVLLVALRADFMGHALTYRRFADTLQHASLLMGPMSRNELRAAIERPAARQGAAFEAGLVDRLLDDVGSQPGNLPMLEFALTLLWDKQDAGLMTHEGYEATGRVEGALARHADEVLANLNVDQQRRARHVFTQLVQPGDGTDDTRRVAARVELIDDDWDLVQYLADKRLVVTGNNSEGQEIVEVVHEALIQRWAKLRSWMGEDHSFRSWQEGLRTAQRAWMAADKDEGALLRGAPLAQAESWLKQRGNELSQAERDFIGVGTRFREQSVLARELRRRRTIAVLTTGLVIALGLVIVALTSRASAQREAANSASLVQAANAAAAFEGGDSDLALAIALEAVDMSDPPPEAVRTLADVAVGVGTRAVLGGHAHSVRGVAMSPDARRAVSASCGDLAGGICHQGELIVWNTENGTEIARLVGHSNWVTDVAYHPDGDRVLSASADGTVLMWDIETGTDVRTFNSAGGVTAVAINPDGRTALFGSAAGDLTMWDLATGEEMRTFEGHRGPVTRVTFGPSAIAGSSGITALSASEDATVILWDLATGEPLRTLEGHVGPVNDAVIHPDGARILSTGSDLSLRMWDIETGTLTNQQDFGVDLGSIAITPDGQTAIFSGKTELRLWDIERWQQSHRLAGHIVDENQEANIYAIDVSRDGRLAISAGSDGTLRTWNVSGQLISRYLTAAGPPLDAIAFSPDAEQLLSGAGTGELVLWDTDQGTILKTFGGEGVPVSPDCIAFSPDGSRALVCNEDPSGATDATSLVLWDVESAEEIRRFEGHASLVRAVAYHPDGRHALAGSQSVPDNLLGDLILWDLETGNKIRTYDITHDVADIAMSSDGRIAVTGSVTGAVAILWDVTTGEQIHRFEGHSAPVLNVAFGPDESTVVTASFDGTLLMWDVETGEIIERFAGHQAGVFALDISEDGRFMMSASDNGTVILWDYQTGEMLRRLLGHTAIVLDVAIHPDGDRAFSAGVDGKLIEWGGFDLGLEELVDWIDTNRHVRDLTCEERAQYNIDAPDCP